MANPNKYKSLSVPIEHWKELGVLADKTDRTRSQMIGRLIRFFKDNKVSKYIIAGSFFFFLIKGIIWVIVIALAYFGIAEL